MDRLLEIDRWLFLVLNGRDWPGWLDAFFVFITDDHNTRLPLIILWLFLLLACGPRWRRRMLWLIPLIALVDYINSQLLKDIFQRPRPCRAELEGLRLLIDCGPAFSFPSSHAANMGAAGLFLALGLRLKRWWPAVFLLPLLVAQSRVHVGVHYPLDVAAGFIFGLGLAWGAESLLRRLPPRFGGLPPGSSTGVESPPRSDAAKHQEQG